MTIPRTRLLAEELPTPRWQALRGWRKAAVLAGFVGVAVFFYLATGSLVPTPSIPAFLAYLLFAGLHGGYAVYHYRVGTTVDRYVRGLIDEPYGGGRQGWRRTFFTWESNLAVAGGLFLVTGIALREAYGLWDGLLFEKMTIEQLTLSSWFIVVWNQVAAVFFLGSLEIFGLSRPLVSPVFPIGSAIVVLMRVIVVAGVFLALKRVYDIRRRITTDLDELKQTWHLDAEERLKRYGARAVPAILRAIRKGTTDRSTAVEILGYIGDTRAVPELCKLLDDPESIVRAEAVEALTSCGDWRFLPRLRALISDEDAAVRKAVVAVMGAWRTPLNIPVLRAGIRDPDESVREIAVKCFCTLIREGVGTEEDVIELLEAVRAMSSVEQLTALEAVATAVRERAMPLLEELRDTAPEDMTRFGAIRLRYAIRTGELDRDDPWLKAEGDGADDENSEERPSGFDDRDFEVAIALLKSYDSDVREETASLLAESKDPRALEPLSALLHDPEPGVREGAVRALVKLERREAASVMVSLLRDPNPDVRRAVADALDDLEAQEFLPDLVAVFADERDENVRWMLFHVISGWDDGRYGDLILAGLDDQNPEVRELAVKHLTHAAEPRAILTLLRRLKSETNEFRLSEVIGALQKAGDPSVASAIEPFRTHESEWVRRAAEEALAWFRAATEPAQHVTVGPEVYERLSKYPFFRAWKEGRLSKELFLENMDAFRGDFFHEEGITPEQYQKIIDIELKARS